MTVPKPPMTYIGTGGCYVTPYTPGNPPKQAVVLHIMGGTLVGCDSWFQCGSGNPGASTHYGIDRVGTIHEYCKPDGPTFPWANGGVCQPWATVRALVAANPGVSPNAWSVAIEHEGYEGDWWTPAQIAAGAQLAAYWIEQLGIPADLDHLLGHNEFDSCSRPNCPGQPDEIWTAYEQAICDWLQVPAYGLTPGPQPVA